MPQLTPEQWALVESLLDAAATLSDNERIGFLDENCHDPEIRCQVDNLLTAGESAAPRRFEAIIGGLAAQFIGGDPGEPGNDSARTPLKPETQLGPYMLLSIIGSGGMGEVWKARDTRLDRIVAIKFLKAAQSTRFEQEARAIAALNHPHICQIHDIGVAPDYLVLEYVEGHVLRGPLEIAEAARLAIQIASALEAAHKRGILHRDLKPANVLVAESGAKLLDFGLAKWSGGSAPAVSETLEGTILGTAAYMSPEQARGQELDERSDIFSFGAVLYEMLCGEPAFSGASTADILGAVIRDEPAPVKAPPALAEIVNRCLRKSRNDRFQSMADVRAALMQFNAQPVVAQPIREPNRGNPASAANVKPHARTSRLPTGTNRLIGRSRELIALRGLLLDPNVRLVNLTGPGGIGKTRLAIEAARDAVYEFENVWFVELEGIHEPHGVASGVVHSVDPQERDARSAEAWLVENLEDRGGLLVLDNFEQVVEAAPLIARLLATSLRLKILVTSRVTLHLRAEREFPLGPLDIGASSAGPEQLLDTPAVALFLERGGITNPAPETSKAIAEICARLDGLPLAIELAAARSRLLPPQAMLARMDKRFQWLRGGPRDLPPRQQALRNAIDWSFDLLSQDEKILMQQLAVFVGGATIDAIEAICSATDDILELLSGLTDKSLLLKQDPNRGARVRMMETIREYALERLDESGNADAVRSRHAGHYLALAERLDGPGNGAACVRRFDSIEGDHGNCLAALDFFLKRDNADLALRMAAALWPFWDARGYWTEGRAQLRRVLLETRVAGPEPSRAKVLYGAGVLADAQGDYVSARAAFEEQLSVQRALANPAPLAAAMNNLGIAALRQGDYDAARAAYEEALQILKSIGSQVNIAQCLNNLGHVAMAKGDYAGARSNYQESLAICRELRSARDTAWTLTNLGDVAREESHFEEAEHLYAQSLGLFQRVDDQAGMANCMADLANLAFLNTRFTSAAQLFQESLVIFGDLGDRRGIARVLEGFAIMASARGDHEAALRLAGAVKSVRESLGLQRSKAQRSRVDASIREARSALGSRAETVWAEGERTSLEKAIEYALSRAVLC